MPPGGRRWAWALAAVAALALGPTAAPVAAHGEFSPTIRTFVDGSDPGERGLEFRIVPGDAARLGAVNRTRSELEVIATGGEAFLRIGPRGVFANVNSIDWYRSGNPDGFARPPAEARIGSPPRWERVARRPEWVWFDHRLHPGKVPLTQEIVSAGRRARLDGWTVPARFGGRDLKVSGHVEYRPILGAVVARLGSSPTPAPGIQAAVLPGRMPGIFLLNAGARPVTVIGKEGEPFARIGPRGTEVNLHSPTHAADQAAKGRRNDVAADASATPRWRRVDSVNRYSWLDSRALYARQVPPDAIAQGGERKVLRKWSVPLELGARRAEIAGTTSWVPSRRVGRAAAGEAGASSWMWLLAGGLPAGLGLLSALAMRRRAAAGSPPREFERVG